jgi:tetratricopeptide (TPR) repeat protein
LVKRGDAHRDMMMQETPPDNSPPEQWPQIRAIHGSRARLCYQYALDAKPDHAYALLNMGVIHIVESSFPDLRPEVREKSLVTATHYIQQSLNVRRLDAQAHYYLGEIAARRGQCDKAIRIFNNLIASKWSYSHVYAWMGYCYEANRKVKEARDAYKKAADIANPIGMGEWAKSRLK